MSFKVPCYRFKKHNAVPPTCMKESNSNKYTYLICVNTKNTQRENGRLCNITCIRMC
jgi:hypothetical protein